MANIHVDYQQLHQAGTRLTQAHEEIVTQLTQLKSMIDGLTESGFKTDLAAPKFQQSYQQWTTGAKNVIDGLNGMTSFINTTVTAHQDLDSQLSQATGS